MKKLLPALMLFLASCAPTWQPEGEETLVVEGWIDAGGFPVVCITTSVPTSTEFQSIDEQTSHIVRWGKVTVSDGENSVVLTGMRDERYFPPYIYTTNALRGEAGKRYTLTVEYSGLTATAETTVPEPVPLDGLAVEPAGDGEYTISLSFTDPPASRDYYRLFVMVEGSGGAYLPSFLGCFSDESLGSPATVQLMRSTATLNGGAWKRNPARFFKGERVHIRLCRMDEASFRFWNSYDKTASLSTVPLFPAAFNPEYNISGALGYWCGYGASTAVITVGE